MKMVVDIPEEIYNRVVVAPRCASDLNAYTDRDMFVKALRTGTLLPQEYGRLIDADELLKKEKPRALSDELWEESHIYKIIAGAPTIIEASN